MFKTAKWIGAERILEKKTDYLSPAVMLRKRFVLKPYFYADNCACQTKTTTKKGEISFKWEKKGEQFKAEILLPKNRCATLFLPNGKTLEISKPKSEIYLLLSE